MDLSNIGGRKMIMAAVLLVVALGVTYIKGDVPSNLLSFLQVLFGAFVLGNSVEHYTDSKGSS